MRTPDWEPLVAWGDGATRPEERREPPTPWCRGNTTDVAQEHCADAMGLLGHQLECIKGLSTAEGNQMQITKTMWPTLEED